ncbi:SOS response-associated peptidase [Paenibacillus turpanensis]|uniref:SOS response-associated peptidase n=1 Tax=Paenibacillus turpanensis TaxID=2689078 RepID=UPI00140E474B|nr:SOS response-associated peptidase [Paenibacillus turpanensis]
MCGRYTITVTMEELMLRFLIEGPQLLFHGPKYNVAPGQMVLAVIHDGERNRIGELKWGLVPEWAKEEKIGAKMLNARAETITEKPAFRTLLTRKRCLIPADGFYEWKKDGGSKQPLRITLKSREVFAMAGLYDTWMSPDGRRVSTCAVITTAPNELVANIHDRMPVILPREAEARWLDRGNRDTRALLELLRPYPAEEMTAYAVSPMVGSVKNDEPACIEPLVK